MMRVDLGEFRAAYLAEVEEHLAGARARLDEIEQAIPTGRATPRATREVVRLLHTIKGLSAMVGVETIVTLVHHMESVVRAADQRAAPIAAEALPVLSEALDAVDASVRDIANSRPLAAPSRSLLARLASLGANSDRTTPTPTTAGDDSWLDGLDDSERDEARAAQSAGRRIVRIRFAPSTERAAAGINITSVRERLARRGEIIKVTPVAEPASARAPNGLVFSIVMATELADAELLEPASGAEFEELAGSTMLGAPVVVEDAVPEPTPAIDEVGLSSSLRVELERVEAALERFSALVVNRARLGVALRSLRESGADVRELTAVMQENAMHMRELRAAILRLRMVPIETVLGSLPLMIRGLARTTRKEVDLVVDSGAAELDKTVAEKLVPALLHLIRNAVDHGIELPEQRRAAGKAPRGLVRVSCSSQGGRTVEIRVSDDGVGIDRDAVAGVAGAPPTDDAALLDVICRPGLSTRSTADTVSGRGMGMDIVRKIVTAELRGELLLETTRGKGTTFVIRVPLSIAIVDGFTVVCDGQQYLVPVPFVEEIVELPRDHSTAKSGLRLLARRGESVPLWDLAKAIGVETNGTAERRHALVVRRGRDELVAFAVDRVVHQQEAVVRPLDDVMLSAPGIAGATDLGDGSPTVVLDLFGLFGRLREASR